MNSLRKSVSFFAASGLACAVVSTLMVTPSFAGRWEGLSDDQKTRLGNGEVVSIGAGNSETVTPFDQLPEGLEAFMNFPGPIFKREHRENFSQLFNATETLMLMPNTCLAKAAVLFADYADFGGSQGIFRGRGSSPLIVDARVISEGANYFNVRYTKNNQLVVRGSVNNLGAITYQLRNRWTKEGSGNDTVIRDAWYQLGYDPDYGPANGVTPRDQYTVHHIEGIVEMERTSSGGVLIHHFNYINPLDYAPLYLGNRSDGALATAHRAAIDGLRAMLNSPFARSQNLAEVRTTLQGWRNAVANAAVRLNPVPTGDAGAVTPNPYPHYGQAVESLRTKLGGFGDGNDSCL